MEPPTIQTRAGPLYISAAVNRSVHPITIFGAGTARYSWTSLIGFAGKGYAVCIVLSEGTVGFIYFSRMCFGMQLAVCRGMAECAVY